MFRLVIRTLLPLLIIGQLSAQEVQFSGLKELNGTKLFVEIVGKGEPVIVIHGGPGLNHHYFQPWLNDLSKKYQLVYFDQRSSGASDLSIKAYINLKNFVEDIEALRKDLGVEKVHLFAHSWGAVIANAYIEKYPEHVASLIYCSPVPFDHNYDQAVNNTITARMSQADSLQKEDIMASEAFQKGEMSAVYGLMHLSFKQMFCDTAKEKLLDLHLQDDYIVASLSLYGLAEDMYTFDDYTKLKDKHFDFPILILHGSCDIMPEAAITSIQQTLPGSKLVEFDHSGHFIFIEEQAAFTKTVLKFLKKVKY
ncbi:MAG: alpha/beta hydrolase [Chitinophagales bacterium]